MSVLSRIMASLTLTFTLSACTQAPDSIALSLEKLEKRMDALEQETGNLESAMDAQLALLECTNRELDKSIPEIKRKYQRPPLDPSIIKKLPEDKKWNVLMDEIDIITKETEETGKAYEVTQSRCTDESKLAIF